MAKTTGKNGRLYLAVEAGGTAEPIPGLNTITIGADTPSIDLTAFEDEFADEFNGTPSVTGSFGGWIDTAHSQLYKAAVDGVKRKGYVYIDVVDNPTKYWYGEFRASQSSDIPKDGGVSVTGALRGAGRVNRSW